MGSRLALVASTLAMLAACSSSSSSATTDAANGPDDAGTSTLDVDASPTADAAATDSGLPGDAGASCSTITVGAPVKPVKGNGAAPSPAGGNLATGTYVLTKHEVYMPDGGTPSLIPSYGYTIAFGASGRVEGAMQLPPYAAEAFAGTYSAAGTQLTSTVTCPKALPAGSVGYTATATQLVLISPDGSGGTAVTTFAKQ